MKTTGTRTYDREEESRQDRRDNDINEYCDNIDSMLIDIKHNHTSEDAKIIKKNMIKTLIDSL